jgi:threonylcarbamoyladenosine tRNA methylthiotransferase MtaB
MATFRIVTLGCRVNQSESDQLAAELAAAGWCPAAPDASCAAIVVNTCAVTGRAAMQSRQAVRKALRANPGARLIVTGCQAQVAAAELAAIAGVEQVVSNRCKGAIAALLGPAPPASRPEAAAPAAPRRTRPLLKVQEGCDAACSYCIVPAARGASRSAPLEAVLRRLAALAAEGAPEVVLTGIHLGAYGRDLSPPLSLPALLQAIAALAADLRVRLSSIEPMEVTDPLIAAVAGSGGRFRPHFHVPLQSGHDPILARMRRPYRAADYAARIAAIAAALPEAAIGADVLVGFPGEEQAAFDATCALVTALPLAYLHVFPFSPRRGTPAAGYPHRPHPTLVAERCRRLRQIGAAKRARFQTRFLGRVREAVAEARRDQAGGRLLALSDNYLTIALTGAEPPPGSRLLVELTAIDPHGRLLGRAVDARAPSQPAAPCD